MIQLSSLKRASEGKEYSETIAFLSLTRTLYPGIYMSEQFDAFMHFIISDVFSTFLNRAYTFPDQKWYGNGIIYSYRCSYFCVNAL